MDELIEQNEEYLSASISKVFSNFFNSYSKHYNFYNKRIGTLFKRAFRRKKIEDIDYLRKLICYIHQNPVEAGFSEQPGDWKYLSYQAIIRNQKTLIPKEEVIGLFGDLDTFVFCNKNSVNLKD